MEHAPVVVVVGGGVSGLSAAWHLHGCAARARVVVLESSQHVGGKLRTRELGGLEVDLGAESLLARRPEALELVHEIGLGEDLVHPVTATANVWSRGRLHRLPSGTVMGVPGTASSLGGLLTAEEVARVAQEPTLPATALEEDVDVASFVTGRMGRAVVDRLVEPLLGGVYAGHASRLSLQATVPALWEHARRGGSLLEVVARSTARSEASGPVFAGIRGGVGRLPLVLAEQLAAAGVEVRRGITVRGLQRTAAGWRLVTGPAGAPEALDADAVVLAVPAPAAARLLAGEVPAAAAELGGVETASVAVVAALVRREDLAGVVGSGVLVPPVEGLAVKAATFSSAKWGWVDALDAGRVLVRVSLGRAREEAVLQREDDELVRLAMADLATVLGRQVRPDVATVVRWGGSLPQFAVGHVDLVRRARAAVATVPGLAVCGAVVDGVGVASCIGAARAAAQEVLGTLRGSWGTLEA